MGRRDTRSKIALVYSVENELKYFSDTQAKNGHFGKKRHLTENELKYFSDSQTKIGHFVKNRHPVEIELKYFSDSRTKICHFAKTDIRPKMSLNIFPTLKRNLYIPYLPTYNAPTLNPLALSVKELLRVSLSHFICTNNNVSSHLTGLMVLVGTQCKFARCK